MAPSGRSKSKEPAKEFKKDQGNSSEQAWAIAAQGFALDVKQAKEWVKSIFKKMDEEQWIITKDREAREERLFTVDEQKKILFLKRWKGFNFFMISLWLNDNGQLAHKVQRSELDYLLDDGDVNEPYDCYEIAAVYVWMSVHRSQLHPEVAELFTASKDLHELPKGEIQVLKYDAQEKKTSEYWVPYMIFLEDVDKWKRHPESGKITVDEFKRKVRYTRFGVRTCFHMEDGSLEDRLYKHLGTPGLDIARQAYQWAENHKPKTFDNEHDFNVYVVEFINQMLKSGVWVDFRKNKEHELRGKTKMSDPAWTTPFPNKKK